MTPAGREREQRRTRRAAAWAGTAVIMAGPFLLSPPGSEGGFFLRGLAAGYAVVLAMKLCLLLEGAADPGMLASWPRRLLWLAVPPATRWPRSPAEAAGARRQAPGALVRGAVKAVVMLVAAALEPPADTPGALAARAVVEALQFWAFLGSLADGLAATLNLAGVHVDPVFRSPWRSRGPAEFWGRRWNLVVGGFARTHVFLPIARRGHPTAAVMATFAASGLMHEYLVAATVGFRLYLPGPMLAFFLLQGLAVLAERAVRWRPPAFGPVVAHLAWITATSPLFFWPLRPVIAAFDAALVRFGRLLLP